MNTEPETEPEKLYACPTCQGSAESSLSMVAKAIFRFNEELCPACGGEKKVNRERYVQAVLIHGRAVSIDNMSVEQVVSMIEGIRAMRGTANE